MLHTKYNIILLLFQYMGCVILVFIGEFSAGIIAAVYKGKVCL